MEVEGKSLKLNIRKRKSAKGKVFSKRCPLSFSDGIADKVPFSFPLLALKVREENTLTVA